MSPKTKPFKIGNRVSWVWGNTYAEGWIQEIISEPGVYQTEGTFVRVQGAFEQVKQEAPQLEASVPSVSQSSQTADTYQATGRFAKIHAGPDAPIYRIRQADGTELFKTAPEIRHQNNSSFESLIAW